MKILMLTDKMDMGGAETHIRELALGLRKMDVEVHLLSGGGSLADALEKEGIRQFRTSLFCRRPIELLLARGRIRRLVKREGYDVLHAHARIPAFLIRGCRRWGCRSVVTVHARFLCNRLLAKLCYWGEHTVAVGEDLRSYVCDVYGVPAECVTTVANGVNCQRFFRGGEGRGESAPKILFASRLDRDCSLGAMLLCELAPALCRSYPALEITVAGGGACLEEIRTEAERINRLLGRVAIRAVGRVEDMAPLFREHDVFVGVSRAAMEAAASGCAVVLCGNEGYGGILCGDSAEKAAFSNFCCRNASKARAERLETDLRWLLERDAFRRSCAKEGEELIQNNFNAETMCQKTLEVYRRVVLHRFDVTLTVGGYFGCGNVGDDAILLGFLNTVRELAPGVGVCALTKRPRHDRRRFGISCYARKNPFSARRAFFTSRAFLCGGGSLLQNATSNRSLRYYLGLLRSARRCGCKTVLFSGGIGPLLGRRAGDRVRKELSACRYISLRDADSLRYLHRLGVPADRLHDGADPALLMPLPPIGRARSMLLERGIHIDDQPLLCVVVRGGSTCRIRRETLIAAVRMVCQKRRLVPVLPILDEEEDGRQSRVAATMLGGYAISLREPSDLTALMSVCAAAVTMRLHGMILASVVALPTLGVTPDPRDRKIASFAKACGQDCLSEERLTVGEIVEGVESCLDGGQARIPILRDAVREMQKKSRKDIANILEMIYNMDNKL